MTAISTKVGGLDYVTDATAEKTTVERDKEMYESIPVGKASQQMEGGTHYLNYEIDPAEFAIKNNIGAYEWDVIQYVLRHQDKGGASDLRKAKHVIDLLLEHKYGE